jgi:hypothetical protein
MTMKIGNTEEALPMRIRMAIMITALSAVAVLSLPAFGVPAVTVAAEEEIYDFVNPDNGSGPLWSFGCSPIARVGEAVYVSQMETGKDVPPLSNTRWRLLRRDAGGWRMLAEADAFRQREPCVLAQGPAGELFLYVNDSTQPPGAMYGNCQPHLLRFLVKGDTVEQQPVMPVWRGEPYYTDHSYRGYAADPAHGQLLMLNIDAKTGVEHACLLSTAGETLANGSITFPIRSCYPQVSLRDGAVSVMAIGDIVEPVEEWRKYKHEQTQRDWDYVFRILYLAETPDLRGQDFGNPLEIANVDATGGHISNKDLWVSPEGEAYLMYTEREVASALLRDKFFPGKSILDTLKVAVVKGGQVISRRTLLEGTDQRAPGDARFHVTPEGVVYAVLNVTGEDAGNKVLQVYPPLDAAPLIPIPLKTPFSSFLLASVRAGNAPSNLIDMYGHTTSGEKLCYAQIRIDSGG